MQFLPDKPEETPDTTLRALWHLVAGNAMSVEAAARATLPTLDAAAEERLRELVARRVAGEPLAHITGRQRFMDLELLTGPGALIPRAETELLGRAAVELMCARPASAPPAVIVDVCTGSGNLALALAHHVGGARVFASDVSEEALALARRNATHLGLNDRVEFRPGDLLAPFEEPAFHAQVDLLVCNPPYISSKRVDVMPDEIHRFEPRIAFDGGPLGVTVVQRLIRDAPRFLRDGGWLAFEVGAGQGPGVAKRIAAGGAFRQQRQLADHSGEVRVLLAAR